MQINQKHLLLLASLLCQQETVLATDNFSMTAVHAEDRQPAPGFQVVNLDNATVNLSDYSGSVILLNFWATWCMPCRREMPGMELLWQKYKDKGFVVLAVSNDEGSSARVKTFTRKFDLSFPVLLDPEGEVSSHYKVSSLPVSFIIDKQGRLAGRSVGSEDWYSEGARQLIDTLLAE